jgi:hypothetical protein
VSAVTGGLAPLRWAAALALLPLVLAASACGGGSNGNAAEGNTTAEGTTTSGSALGAAPDPSDCSSDVDHELVPLTSVGQKVFEGSEKDPDTGVTILTRAEQSVLAEPETVAGYPVTGVESHGFEDGAQVDRTVAYYTQCSDGSVWFVGEKVDDIEDGEVVGHDGQWEAGQEGAKPGLFMPGDPKLRQTFRPEQVPDVAEGRSTVVEIGVPVRTKAGRFTDCVKTKDFSPIDDVTEFKIYCPGVGLVREQSSGLDTDLLRYS